MSHASADTTEVSVNEMGTHLMSGKVSAELATATQFSATRLVDAIVHDAFQLRASDVHLDPGPEGLTLRYRVDGQLHGGLKVPKHVAPEVIARLKILSSLRTDEHQAAQDGRFRLSFSPAQQDLIAQETSVNVRVSIVPTHHGENAVLRILTDQADEYSLESLGFTKAHCALIERSIARPHGMILATGPTGSGKTTTLYTLIKMLQKPHVSIITIEDPIEYAISGINQIQVNASTSLTFSNGLRSMLRQDPNVIMVGEIRDIETAGLAVNTALTGHLVLSTLHTNDAPTTLPRLLDMRVEPYLVASTVHIAIGQRLVRRVCTTCKQAHKLTEGEKSALLNTIPKEVVHDWMQFVRGAGCAACNFTGYRGRAGVYEILELTPRVREAILRKASSAEVRAVALLEGMVPLIVDGFTKALSGITTIEEVLRMSHE